jgi:hypothetical protein
METFKIINKETPQYLHDLVTLKNNKYSFLKENCIRTIPATYDLIWISGFRKDLYVIFYQNMPNLHNWYKSTERKIIQKNPEYSDYRLLGATSFRYVSIQFLFLCEAN